MILGAYMYGDCQFSVNSLSNTFTHFKYENNNTVLLYHCGDQRERVTLVYLYPVWIIGLHNKDKDLLKYLCLIP